MALVTAADLADLRAEQDDSLPDSCRIIRTTLVSDNAGGQTPTETTLATLDCRYAPSQAKPVEGEIGGVLQARQYYDFTFGVGAPEILKSDKLQVVATGITYEVTDSTHSSYRTAARISAVELE